MTHHWHLAEAVTPVAGATSDIVSYILGYGVLGIAAVIMGLVLLKGTFIASKTADARVTQARAEARADLTAENTRLLTEKDKVQERLDSSIRLVQEQLFPMLTSFTSATNSLLPVLQQLVARGYISSGPWHPGPDDPQETHDTDPAGWHR